MRSTETHPSSPVSYDPSIVIIAQGRKRGRLGARAFTYDARNYLVLAVPLPFECETIGTPEEPMLGMAVRVNPATVAELLLEQDAAPQPATGSPHVIAATPLTTELSDAAVRLAKCLRSPVEAIFVTAFNPALLWGARRDERELRSPFPEPSPELRGPKIVERSALWAPLFVTARRPSVALRPPDVPSRQWADVS